MRASLKKQTKEGRKNTSDHVTVKKVASAKKYLSSVKEYQPEIIKGYTYAF